MKTRASINFGLVDVTAKDDSSLTITDKQNFVNVSDLKKDDLEEVKYGTLEKNQFALDGTFNLMPSKLENMGWWSKSMSDSNGNFETPPTLTVNFTENHSSLGLTFLFSETGDYCNHLKIDFYNSNYELISSNEFYPNKSYYFCRDVTENYQKIVITFYSTNNPYRYLKLYKILYGAEIVFEGDNLIDASVLEEVNLLSSEISINTLDFTCFSDNDDFNILNPQGAYKMLQQRQKFSVKEYLLKQNKEKEIGSFYLDTWSQEKTKTMKFGAIDLIGIIDKTNFNGGMYTDITLEELLTDIFTSASLDNTEYEIQEDLKNITLTGYIPICTHREALQQALFAVGAIADCSRSEKIKIYTLNDDEPYIIGKESVIQGTRKIEQSQLITGVQVSSHNYVEAEENQELFKGTLASGETRILFNNPVYGIICIGGSIVKWNCNYAIISCETESEVIITGYNYEDNIQTYLVEIPELDANQKADILTIENAYLVNKNNAMSVAQRVLNYYYKSYTTNFDLILGDEELSKNVTVEEDYNQYLDGNITKLEIDLTGGFIGRAEINSKLEEENG